MDRYTLKEVADLQSIKGIPFPSGVSFRQLLITGPPGVGKTTLVDAIGGWPEEGFVDVTRPNWWRSRVLAFRPRQIHLGLPFAGHDRALSVFEDAWLEGEDAPVLELERIQLPPLGSRRDPWRWRRKYVFEFLLPPPEKVFDVRSRRSDRHSHLVDERLSLPRVAAQLETSWRVARHLHLSGMPVYVRDDFGGRPKVFAEEPATDVVEKQLRGEGRSRNRSLLHTYVKRIISPSGYRVLDRFEEVELRGRRALVPLRILPVEVRSGDQRLELHPDADDAVRLFDPEQYALGPAPFARLLPGDLVRLPDEDGFLTPHLPRDVPARMEIGHEGDWLTVVDLDSPAGTGLRALHGDATRRLRDDRSARVVRLRAILDGMPPHLAPDRAAADLEAAIEVLEQSVWRPRNRHGEPGGLVELPDGVVPVIVGDLHARIDNLVTVLSEGRTLDALEEGRAALVLLGDVVHPEDGDLADMTASLLAHDVVVRLMVAFPGRVIHLRGNHETFSSEITKAGVAQGRRWKARVAEERGTEAVRRMRRFYELLPYVVTGAGFVACHAGPPTGTVSRRKLVDLSEEPRLSHAITWGRVRTPRRPGGYTKRDVRALQKALEHEKPSVMIVSHNPGPDQDAIQFNHGGIKRHHLVYSARADRVAAFTRVGEAVAPLVYPARADFTARSADDQVA